jgi:hypothetical protein
MRMVRFAIASNGVCTATKPGVEQTIRCDDWPADAFVRRISMRKVILASIAAVIVTAPLAAIVKAEDTTVIKRDSDGDKTVVKKKEELHVLPVPHTEESTTVIKKERD